MYLNYFILFFFLLNAQLLLGQDTVATLQELTVESNRPKQYGMGTKIQSIDSLTLNQYNHQNLDQLIAQQTGAFIKNYGPSNIASIALRGSNANQTTVLWNGLNLQSAFLGQVDFSLIPNSFIEDLKIQYGSSGSLNGSGAIGGAIHLNQKPFFDQKLKVGLGSNMGSFGMWQQTAHVKFGLKNWGSQIKFNYNEAQNNFPFLNSEQEKQRMPNAARKYYGFYWDNYFKINKNQIFSLFLWHQQTDRQIPPTLLSKVSIAEQFDQFWRIASHWQYLGDRQTWNIRGGIFTEQLDYKDQISSKTKAISYLLDAEHSWKWLKKHEFLSGISIISQYVNSSNYAEERQLLRGSFFVKYKYTAFSQLLNLALGLRKEQASGYISSPFVPFIGLESKWKPWLSFTGNFAGSYRIPTLNDLYWQDGFAVGNPKLKTEKGYNVDLGFRLNFPLKNKEIGEVSFSKFTFAPNFFSSVTSNTIQWLPNESGIWSPTNIQMVWSRGLETQSSFETKWNNWHILFSISTNYVVSTNEQERFAGDQSYKKQLIYTPIYNHQGNLRIGWKKIQLHINQTYTGYRFVSSDNTKALAPFWLNNCTFSYRLDYKKNNANLFIQINNLTNHQYQVIQNFPMPGINFITGIKINFNS